jgi:hypothetical protein
MPTATNFALYDNGKIAVDINYANNGNVTSVVVRNNASYPVLGVAVREETGQVFERRFEPMTTSQITVPNGTGFTATFNQEGGLVTNFAWQLRTV